MNFTQQEQNYYELIVDMLDDGIIDDSERSLLNKKKDRYGISDERAKEIEDFALQEIQNKNKPKFNTEGEEEYYELLEDMLDDCTIDESERSLLNKRKSKYGISDERAKEFEDYIKSVKVINNNTVSNSSSQETNTPVQEPSQEENNETEEVSVKGEYAPNLEVVNTISPIETYYGKITAYGPDCYGCTTGMTASGQYVMDGNIYYYDETFGNIRIVAADSSIPFGSIIKITGLNISSDPVIAIVLDRGGAIGFASGKHAYFDLLYKSEQDALSFGVQTATFELLRKSY